MNGEPLPLLPPWCTPARLAFAIGALALVLRAWHPEALGIGHYDEGVYAVSAQGVADWPRGDLFPGQVRFSPPLWFTAVGVVTRLTGVAPDVVATGLNVILGAALAGLTCWIGATWFGAVAGAAAGLFAATSPLAIMLSRSGLTDPLFTLLFMLALVAVIPAMERGGWWRILLAGVLTGLAWNTKYHGWFVLVIAAGALVIDWWHRHRPAVPAPLGRTIGRWLLVAVVATACYLPWLLYMRAASGHRGLGGVANYYLSLIGEGWWRNAGQHVAMQLALDNPVARWAAIAVLLLVAVLAWPRLDPRRWTAAVVGMTMLTLLGSSLAAQVSLAIVGAVAAWRDRGSLRVATLFAWLALWLFAAPLYHPYARLLLPMMPVVAVLGGIGLARITAWAAAPDAVHASRAAPLSVTVAAILAVVLVPSIGGGLGDPWADATGTHRIATTLADRLPSDARIAVLGEPALGYYLARGGRAPLLLTGDIEPIDSATTPVLLLAGVYARRAPSLRRELDELGSRLDSLDAFEPAPTDLRLLDDLNPGAFRRWRRSPDSTFAITLYRVAPRSGGAGEP